MTYLVCAQRRQEECKMLSELIPTCLSLSVRLCRLSRYFFAIWQRHFTYLLQESALFFACKTGSWTEKIPFRMHQNSQYWEPKSNFFLRLTPNPSPVGRGTPLRTPHPPRCLRRLDPRACGARPRRLRRLVLPHFCSCKLTLTDHRQRIPKNVIRQYLERSIQKKFFSNLHSLQIKTIFQGISSFAKIYCRGICDLYLWSWRHSLVPIQASGANCESL